MSNQNPAESTLQKCLSSLYLVVDSNIADEINQAVAIYFNEQKNKFKEKFLSESFGALDVVADSCTYIESPEINMFCEQVRKQLRKQAEISF